MGDNLTNPDKSIRQIVHMPPNRDPSPHLGALVPVSASIQNEQKEKQEMEVEEEIDEILIRKLAAKASGLHKEFGHVLGSLLLSHEKKGKELTMSNKVINELKAKEKVLSAQLLESNEQNVGFNSKIEEIEKKAELSVQRANSEEAIWRKKFIDLNEQLTTLKNESEEKDNNIRVLIEKATDNETKITQLEAKVLNGEMSERKLKKEFEEKEKEVECFSKKVTQGEIKISELEEKMCNLESSERKLKEEVNDKDKDIRMLNGKIEEKCTQFLKMEGDFDKITSTNKELNTIIANFVKKKKADEIAMQASETSFKLRVKELEAKILDKCTEITKLSDQLHKEKEKNKVAQGKINEEIKVMYERVKILENGDKVTIKKLKTERDHLKLRAKDLKTELKSLKKQNDDFRSNFRTILETAHNSVTPEKSNKLCKRTVSCSSSSEEETSPESSSSSMADDGGNESKRSKTECLDPQDAGNITLGKRKHPPRAVINVVKKQREDAISSIGQNALQNKLITFTGISQNNFDQKSNTEGNTEIAGKSSTSRSTRSSSGRRDSKETEVTVPSK